MEKGKKKATVSPRKDAFASIALWQFMAFILLLCFVWASELMDLPALIFGAEETPFNLFRVCILSAAIITAGVVAVGHSYERQRRLVRNLLMTCLYCHRVKTDKGKWLHVEEYFLEHYPVAIDRNACPECQTMLKSVEELEKNAQAE
jgi:hypothetical protein